VGERHLTPIALTPDSLRACFGKPLHEAARTLGICATAIKRICRKMGIKEWPFQHITPIKKRLAQLQSSTATPDVLRNCKDSNVRSLRDATWCALVAMCALEDRKPAYFDPQHCYFVNKLTFKPFFVLCKSKPVLTLKFLVFEIAHERNCCLWFAHVKTKKVRSNCEA
jgi:hypothetical protein